MSKINDLNEFLAWRGFQGETPYRWARCFYKYVDCGPWAVFLVAGEPARDEEFKFMVHRSRAGRLKAFPYDEGDTLPPDEVLRCFGFDQNGAPRKEDRDVMKSLKAYYAALVEFRDRLDSSDKFKVDLIHKGPEDPKPGERQWIFICVSRHVDALIHEVYYEDLRREDSPEVTNENCVGIKFGSIVEGSEANSGPFEHVFPFETADFERDEEWMEKETEHYWIRDNSQWYVLQVRDRTYYLRNTWGDIVWEEKPSPKLLKKVEAFIEERFDEIPHEPGYWHQPGSAKDWAPMKIPGSVAGIYETYNDSVF